MDTMDSATPLRCAQNDSVVVVYVVQNDSVVVACIVQHDSMKAPRCAQNDSVKARCFLHNDGMHYPLSLDAKNRTLFKLIAHCHSAHSEAKSQSPLFNLLFNLN